MADHWRTSRTTPGGVRQLPGSPHGAGTRADSISLPSGPSLKRRKISEPPFDERELSAGFLFFAMVVAPLLFVGLIVLCHRTFG